MKWLCVFGLMIGLVSCGVDMPKETKTSYDTMVVEKQNITVPVKFSAKLKGQSDVVISPQVNGQLMRIGVSEGQQVKKGATLFIIDSRNAQLDLEVAEANLLAAQASERSAKLEYESNKNLFEKNIVSSYMLDNSENAYRQAQAAVSRSKVNLGFCTITSPVTGVVGDVPVYAGDQVGPGTRLTIVSRNDYMDAQFSIPESVLEEAYSGGYQGKMKDAMDYLPDVTFLMKNGTEYARKGRITRASGMVNATTGTIACKATFPNPDGILYSGIQGTIILPIDTKDVIVIPQVAVVRLQDKSLVYKVLPDNTATAVTVTTESFSSGQDIIITSGLEVGDKIVTVGANNVTEGQRVIF